jgi:hypothetical protein
VVTKGCWEQTPSAQLVVAIVSVQVTNSLAVTNFKTARGRTRTMNFMINDERNTSKS